MLFRWMLCGLGKECGSNWRVGAAITNWPGKSGEWSQPVLPKYPRLGSRSSGFSFGLLLQSRARPGNSWAKAIGWKRDLLFGKERKCCKFRRVPFFAKEERGRFSWWKREGLAYGKWKSVGPAVFRHRYFRAWQRERKLSSIPAIASETAHGLRRRFENIGNSPWKIWKNEL